MKIKIIDWEKLRRDIVKMNDKLVIFDWTYLEQLILRYWDRADVVCENKVIFYERFKTIIYTEMMRFLRRIMADNYLFDNLKLALGGEVITTSSGDMNSNTQTVSRTDPLNPDGTGVYYSGSESETDNIGGNNSKSTTIDSSKSIDGLSKLDNWLNLNNAYDTIAENLTPLYRIIEFRDCKSNCCCEICTMNFYTKSEVDALISNVEFDFEGEVINESTDEIAPIIELQIVKD